MKRNASRLRIGCFHVEPLEYTRRPSTISRISHSTVRSIVRIHPFCFEPLLGALLCFALLCFTVVAGYDGGKFTHGSNSHKSASWEEGFHCYFGGDYHKFLIACKVMVIKFLIACKVLVGVVKMKVGKQGNSPPGPPAQQPPGPPGPREPPPRQPASQPTIRYSCYIRYTTTHCYFGGEVMTNSSSLASAMV